MIYLLSGKTNERNKYIRSIADKHSYIPQHVYDNDVQNNSIDSIVSVQIGLFGDKEMYVIHSLCRTINVKELLREYAESDNIYIFSEDTVTKPIIKVFEKHECEIKDFGKELKEKKSDFNMFSITDALGARDKKQLWLLFQQAIKNGSPEEIHGILYWQVKNLTLVKSSQTNPGMNPFVYTKTQNYANKYSNEEIYIMAQELTHMFHKRDTYSTLEIELEKFILNI